jgi:hypothetical protein
VTKIIKNGVDSVLDGFRWKVWCTFERMAPEAPALAKIHSISKYKALVWRPDEPDHRKIK